MEQKEKKKKKRKYIYIILVVAIIAIGLFLNNWIQGLNTSDVTDVSLDRETTYSDTKISNSDTDSIDVNSNRVDRTTDTNLPDSTPSTNNNPLQVTSENSITLHEYLQETPFNRNINNDYSRISSELNEDNSYIQSNRKAYDYATILEGDYNSLDRVFSAEVRLDGKFSQLQCNLLIEDKDDGTKGRGGFALYDVDQRDDSRTVESYVYRTLCSTDDFDQQYKIDEGSNTAFKVNSSDNETDYAQIESVVGIEPMTVTIDLTNIEVLGVVLRGNARILDAVLIYNDDAINNQIDNSNTINNQMYNSNETSNSYTDYSNMTQEEAKQFLDNYMMTDTISDEEFDKFMEEYAANLSEEEYYKLIEDYIIEE